jgi:hypothetical protein
MQITIIDIARFTDSSKSTLSRALNESGPVEALNYKPNAVARNLALKRSNSLSMIVQDIRNPYLVLPRTRDTAGGHLDRVPERAGMGRRKLRRMRGSVRLERSPFSCFRFQRQKGPAGDQDIEAAETFGARIGCDHGSSNANRRKWSERHSPAETIDSSFFYIVVSKIAKKH